MSLLRRIARRCETHDVASPYKIRQLEEQTGQPRTNDEPLSLIDQFANPDLIDCGHTWCPRGR
ncbi:hypothetical protein [Streptomyces sp. NPDC058612]|uniref:hypothetical protein n=1 Tax=Streptomyces sp. NPDC058612 TaxID=3346555 RepID=UPI003666DBAD